MTMPPEWHMEGQPGGYIGLKRKKGFPGGVGVIRDMGLIPGLGRSPGEEHGNPFQYSFPENPMDRGAWWATVLRVAKSRTRLNDFPFTFHFMHGRRKWQPTPVWAIVQRIAKSGTQLKD